MITEAGKPKKKTDKSIKKNELFKVSHYLQCESQ